MKPQKPTSFWSKSFNWLTKYAYRQIPALIASYSTKNSQPKSLSYEDYLKSPDLAREAGLMCVRQMSKDFIKRKQAIQKVVSGFKSRTDELTEKPHEFNCPICLELMNGPVTTSCHHTFCQMCLDEAVLFNQTCPVCRNKIRGEELIVSNSIQKLIQIDNRFLHKLELEEVEKFVKKELQYEEWIEKRSIKKEQIDIGDCIDVRDTEFIWCRATILDIFPLDCETKSQREMILVHYEGWANVFNEMIPLDSQRLAQYKFYTSRLEIPHYNLSADNNEHLRSPVVSGPQINHPPLLLQSSNSFEYNFEHSQDIMSQSSFRSSFPLRRSEDIRNQISLSEHNQSRNLDFRINRVQSESSDDDIDFFNAVRNNLIQIDNQPVYNFSGGRISTQSLDEITHLQSAHDSWRNNIHNRSLPELEMETFRYRRNELNEQLIQLISSREQSQTITENSQPNQYFDYDLVQSLQFYSKNGHNLNAEMELNANQNRINKYNSASISYLGQRQSERQDTNPSYDNIHLNRFMELYFKSPEEIPFNVDIEEIKGTDVSLELLNLQKAQQQMQIKIQTEQKQVKSEMDKWNKLNQMIDNYFEQTQNPQTQIYDDFHIYDDWMHNNFEINCLIKNQINPTQQIKFQIQQKNVQNVRQQQINELKEQQCQDFKDQKQAQFQVDFD